MTVSQLLYCIMCMIINIASFSYLDGMFYMSAVYLPKLDVSFLPKNTDFYVLYYLKALILT